MFGNTRSSKKKKKKERKEEKKKKNGCDGKRSGSEKKKERRRQEQRRHDREASQGRSCARGGVPASVACPGSSSHGVAVGGTYASLVIFNIGGFFFFFLSFCFLHPFVSLCPFSIY